MHRLQENRLLISPEELMNLEWARRSSIKHSRTRRCRPPYLNLLKEPSKISMSYRKSSATARLRCWLRKSRVLKARIGLALTSLIMGRTFRACAVRSQTGSRNHPRMGEESRTLTTFPPPCTSRGETSRLSLTATLWAPLPRMPRPCLKANLEAEEQMECTRHGARWVWIREGARSSLDLSTTSSQSGAITSITDYFNLYL
jgi:hypothetical protein